MTEQLVWSFLRQKFSAKELVLSDDSPGSEIGRIAQRYEHLGVRYFRNERQQGYCRNLYLALTRATGKYIFVLGDDDVFLSDMALSRYVEAFERFPNVDYIYCGQVQASADLRVERVFRPFSEEKILRRGSEALTGIWLTSLFIPGIGLRNNGCVQSFYPDGTMLFPQFELVGHLLARGDGLIIPDILVAGRAHDDQLGFHILRGHRRFGKERHACVETLEIARRIFDRYRLGVSEAFIEKHMIGKVGFIFLKDKLVVETTRLTETFHAFIGVSRIAQRSARLRALYLLAVMTPRKILHLARKLELGWVSLRNRAHFRRLAAQLHGTVRPPAASLARLVTPESFRLGEEGGDATGQGGLVSVVVTTRNSARTLRRCLESVRNQSFHPIELIVVDNCSSDDSKSIAAALADRVIDQGPERSVQRNRGAREAAGKYVFFVDSDMELEPNVVEQCVGLVRAGARGVAVPEVSVGNGFWARCKAFERSFYVADVLTAAARFFRRDGVLAVGGYDAALTGPEDWDLSMRVCGSTPPAFTRARIYHDEGRLTLSGAFRKKYYYGRALPAFVRKHGRSAWRRLNPARPSLLRSTSYIAGRPALGTGLLIMKAVELLGALLGAATPGFATRSAGYVRRE